MADEVCFDGDAKYDRMLGMLRDTVTMVRAMKECDPDRYEKAEEFFERVSGQARD